MKLIKAIKYIVPVLLMLLSASGRLFSQEIRVTGRVTDDQNEPLIGVTIMVINERTGTISDEEGNFSLSCNAGDSMKFSYIGYKAKTLAPAPVMNVILETDVVELETVTVVAIGYGTMRKTDLTGSISSVSSDDFKQGMVNSSEQLLQGKIAGLTVIQGGGNPAHGSSIRLRGGTSLSASNGPLVVVDGIPGVDINTVQPSEIVSMDVLKDASAAAIYGSRGANGVIMITTNRQNKGKSVEYSGYYGTGKVARHLDLLSADQWRKYMRDNNITSAIDYGANTDWQKEIEQTAHSQSHNISFHTGGENSGLRASLTYLDSEGVIRSSYLNRIGASITGFQYGLDDRLKVELGLHANSDKWSEIDNSVFRRAYNLNPTIPVKQNGEFTQVGGTNNNNAVEILENRSDNRSRKRLLGYGKTELTLLKDLKGIANLSYEYNAANGSFYLPSYSFYGMTDKGYGNRNLSEYQTIQLETYLTYEKKLFDMLRTNLMAGYSYLDNVYNGFGSERRGFDTDFFGSDNLGAGQDYRTGDVYSYKGEAKLISFFGRINLNMKERYLLTATLRRDGSSRFGENNKWGVFPSVSLGWRISEESFMQGTKGWLTSLKLRAGYGVTGNQDGIGEYKSLFLLGAGGASYYDAATGKWKQSYGPIQNPNPDLKWESTAQTNAGLDFSLFNRISGTVEYYHKKTSDLLFTYNVPQPPYLYGTMMANVGDLTNRGYEVTLNAAVIRGKNFSWNTNLTMAHNKQVVDKLSDETYQTDVVLTGSLHQLTGMSNTFAQVLKEGYAVGTFWGPKCTGIDEEGKFILANNGEPTDLGNAQPKMSLGLSMDFSYKSTYLIINTYGLFGQKILNATAMDISYPGRLPGYNVKDSFLESGIKSEPLYSSYWIEDGSFLRMQSITLGHNLRFEKLGLKSVNIYLTGENLFVITGYDGIDPEVSIEGIAQPGIDFLNYYPQPRNIIFGLKVAL